VAQPRHSFCDSSRQRRSSDVGCSHRTSAISFNANNQIGEIGATLLLQVNHRVSAALAREHEVVGIKGILFSLPLTIGRCRRVDMLRDGIGKVELAGNHFVVV
jgi:hypothetical protein